MTQYPRVMRILSLVSLCMASAVLVFSAAAQTPELSPALRPYAACQITGGPDLVETTPTATPVSVRTVKTQFGDKQVHLVDGAHLVFSYPEGSSFANLRIEQIAAANYAQEKASLIANFDTVLIADEATERDYMLKPAMHGFEIYGLNRKKLEGNNLGIYMMFDNKTHVETTFYFLNSDPSKRKFASMDEFAGLRDQFLYRYTTCVRGKLDGAPPAAKKPAAKKPTKRK